MTTIGYHLEDEDEEEKDLYCEYCGLECKDYKRIKEEAVKKGFYDEVGMGCPGCFLMTPAEQQSIIDLEAECEEWYNEKYLKGKEE